MEQPLSILSILGKRNFCGGTGRRERRDEMDSED